MTRPDLAERLLAAQQALGFHTERPPITRQWFDLIGAYLLAPPDQRDAMFFALAGEFCALQASWAKLDAQLRPSANGSTEAPGDPPSPPGHAALVHEMARSMAEIAALDARLRRLEEPPTPAAAAAGATADDPAGVAENVHSIPGIWPARRSGFPLDAEQVVRLAAGIVAETASAMRPHGSPPIGRLEIALRLGDLVGVGMTTQEDVPGWPYLAPLDRGREVSGRGNDFRSQASDVLSDQPHEAVRSQAPNLSSP